ncbi:putative Choline Transporter-like (CTL) Family Protein [Monocercomonoides exilis]|uniref:putative Choline Transporter-like (CTL) Family Protein n=1 Tax=Monocercomonoides exilis TaxID=2049356 RepID=UPI0035594475|nr:putative Choline Transporter-like (CTL) Family Protein [Monocercomonoides exilis]|eukprot:MONOS_8305.1-p1 / transcript=MONOS_8305.1 / gene=MONOS_8305 / organism=Monocercomonoides_exilis_PA203 / gene_product=Choline Transporter-like (CTL) Family Protein / transcript_product=Choline Transporter-like (CTL) Family Protein / location=Mono_scaffold00310:31630-34047(+) / protein_length=726 / sequence_SO=supercontig / SO=protein_coding / is_pseudo=false
MWSSKLKMFFLISSFPDLGEKESELKVANGKLDHNKIDKKCRDVKCLIAFIVVVVLFLAFFIYSAVASNFENLTRPTDYQNEMCGLKGDVDMTQRPNLFSPSINYENRGWCVKSCPTQQSSCICMDSEPFEATPETCNSMNETCYYMNEVEFIVKDFRCIPSNATKDSEWNQKAGSFIKDFVASFWTIIVGAAIAIVLCFLYMACMGCCARACVWGCIGVSIGFIFLAGVAAIIIGIVFMSKSDSSERSAFYALIAVGLVILLIGLISSCCACCWKERITLASYIIEAAANAVKSMPCLPCCTVLFSIISAAVSVMCFFAIVFFISSRDFVKEQGSWTISIPGYAWVFFIFVLIAYIWMIMFVFGMNEMTIGGSISSWYFTRDRSKQTGNLDKWPVFSAFKRGVRYHSGSVAFGSGLITICTVLQILSEMMADSASDTGNDVIACLCACISCILQCISKYLEFVTSRVYVLISIKGTSYWKSAKQTLFLVLRNIIRTAVLENVVTLIFGIAEFLIDIVSIFFLLMMVRPDIFGLTSKNVVYLPSQSWWLSLILGFLLIVFVVDTIFDTLSFSVTSIFMSFLLDDEMCQTHPEWNPFGTPELRERMYKCSVAGYQMAQKYKDKHEDFNLAYFAEPPQTYVDPYMNRGSMESGGGIEGYNQPTTYPTSVAFESPSTQPQIQQMQTGPQYGAAGYPVASAYPSVNNPYESAAINNSQSSFVPSNSYMK